MFRNVRTVPVSTMVQNCTLEKCQHLQNVPVTTSVVNHTAIKIGTNVDYTGVAEKKRRMPRHSRLYAFRLRRIYVRHYF